jgi:hypothetical protein
MDNWVWIVFFALPVVAMWVYALVTLFKSHDMSALARTLWILVILALPVMGTLIFVILHGPGPGARAGDQMLASDAGGRKAGAAAYTRDTRDKIGPH